jgi:hypothetical protein
MNGLWILILIHFFLDGLMGFGIFCACPSHATFTELNIKTQKSAHIGQSFVAKIQD